jgi:glycosyltransferase involved in cell wall biosynthesis
MNMQLYKNFQPDVSIILPTFNRVDYLERSINSVLIQTFTNWELLIIDDGSSDSTFSLVNKFLLKDERIRFSKHKNVGLPITLNIGINSACGKFITFLGSDDEYLPEHLQLRISEIEKGQNLDCLFGGVEIIGNPFVKDKNDSLKEVHIKDCIVGGTFFGKRNMFLELNGFKDIKYSEDSEFYERAIEKYKFKKVDFPTYIYYRDTPNSICNTI